MIRYLSLFGLLFLGVGMMALSSQGKAAAKPPRLPNDGPEGRRLGKAALPPVPSFHARFSVN